METRFLTLNNLVKLSGKRMKPYSTEQTDSSISQFSNVSWLLKSDFSDIENLCNIKLIQGL